MIEKDFKIDFKSKKIGYNSKGSGETYTVNKLYSLIMDLLDEPEYMKYDIPIEAVGKGEFRLASGWTIDKKAKKHLKGSLGLSGVEPLWGRCGKLDVGG